MAARSANTTPRDSRIEKRIRQVPEDRRTHARDEAAREILTWMQDPEIEWPLNGSEMERRGEYSAQHYRFTRSMYELEDSDVDRMEEGGSMDLPGGVDLEIPGDVDAESYARGWISGYLRARDTDE